MILYDEDAQTLARIILRPRSILAHLANPAKPYNRILHRVEMHLGATGMLQLEKRPEPVQKVGGVLAFC